MTPTKQTHSPLPWKPMFSQKDKAWDIVREDPLMPVSRYPILKIQDNDEFEKENAQFICLAVNNHEKLVKAAKIAIKDIENGSLGNAVSVLRFALSQIEEESK